MVPSQPRTSTSNQIDPTSLGFGVAAYLIWGFFPLYFRALSPAGSLEVIVHRAVWGLLSCIAVIALFSRWDRLKAVIADRQAVIRLTIAGLLILVNWTVYVYAVQSGHTVDAARGSSGWPW